MTDKTNTPLTDALDEAVFSEELRYFRMLKHARELEAQLAEARKDSERLELWLRVSGMTREYMDSNFVRPDKGGDR